jgi:Flp pilus assembly protein TadG
VSEHLTRARLLAPGRRRERGQSVVEFALIVPVITLILLGTLEFGLAFNNNLTLEYATREGSRTGSGLGNGGSTNCAGGVDKYLIDAQTVAAVQRILKSPGSPVSLSDVTEIRLYHANASGQQIGSQANTWRYTPGAGPDIDTGLAVERLDFSSNTTGWPVCSRVDGPTADSIGVQVSYTYNFTTPLGALIRLLRGTSAGRLNLVDKTVMALNPTE